MPMALHPKDDIDRIRIKKKGEGKRLATSEDCIDASIQRFKGHIKKEQGNTNHRNQS